jgi:dTDP-4-dehydrorhamnose reductase
MRVLILGGAGMLGHQLFRHLSRRHEVKTTLQRRLADYPHRGLLSQANSYDDFDDWFYHPRNGANCRTASSRVPNATGGWHVSSEPITKFDLLSLAKRHFRLNTEIVADATFACDRSLASSRFRPAFNYVPPTWDAMINEIARDGDLYS